MDEFQKKRRDLIYEDIFYGYHTKEEIFNLWVEHSDELGVIVPERVDRNFKFSLRSERTPSASPFAASPGYAVKDFGSGELFSPMSRLQELHGLSKKEAMERIFSWYGEGNDGVELREIKFYDKPQDIEPERKPYPERVIQQYLLNAIHNEGRFNDLATGFFRACTPEEIQRARKLLRIGYCPVSKYDKIERLMLFEVDKNNVAYGHYKYNRMAESEGYPKGVLRKNAKRVLLGSHLIKKFGEDIIVAEGHTDFVNNIAKGLACITTGSSTKRLEQEDLDLLAGKHLHDFPDLDFPGIFGAMQRKADIAEWNRNNKGKKPLIKHTIYAWSSMFASAKEASVIQSGNIPAYSPYKHCLNKVKIKNGVAIFNTGTILEVQRDHFRKKSFSIGKGTAKSMGFDSWILLSRPKKMSEIKKEGYDFVDFHLENQDNPNYNKFLAKFKF